METTATPTHAWRPFLRHLGEMLLAMFAGMIVLGAAAEGIFAIAGGSLGEAPAAAQAWIMAVAMTVPMVWWMRRRGHAAARSAEMAAAMIVPTFLVVDLHWVGLLDGTDAVLAIQHAIMIPAMVATMLWRREHYMHH
ncbi:MAG: hypothetical protein M3340_20650 [Actinomycetota bacterium]|nr:hypothetical protein [Actinomycetota bacterium]